MRLPCLGSVIVTNGCNKCLLKSAIVMHDCIKWLSNRPELQDQLFHYLTARGKQVLLAAFDKLQVQNLASSIGAAVDDC